MHVILHGAQTSVAVAIAMAIAEAVAVAMALAVIVVHACFSDSPLCRVRHVTCGFVRVGNVYAHTDSRLSMLDFQTRLCDVFLRLALRQVIDICIPTYPQQGPKFC